MAQGAGRRCSVRQSRHDPNRWFFDFDAAAPGGRGGGSVLLDPALGLASIDSIRKNVFLPRRSSGALLAEVLILTGMARPAIVEVYNVERTTRQALSAGGNGQGTLLGNFLEDTAKALGGVITRWEAIPDGGAFHLRVHVAYP